MFKHCLFGYLNSRSLVTMMSLIYTDRTVPAMANRQNVAFKVLTTVVSVLSGLLAGALSKRIWAWVGPTSPPAPKDLSRGVGEVLVAAAVQGAIFALVQAAFDRAGAHAITAVTDETPA